MSFSGNFAYAAGSGTEDIPTQNQMVRCGTGGLLPAVVKADTDAAAIPVTAAYTYVGITSTGATDTRTLARPTYIGQRMIIHHDVDGGACTVTATGGFNQAADADCVFTAVGGLINLVATQRAAGVFAWSVAGFGIKADDSNALDPTINA